jgi:hypothetical protein
MSISRGAKLDDRSGPSRSIELTCLNLSTKTIKRHIVNPEKGERGYGQILEAIIAAVRRCRIIGPAVLGVLMCGAGYPGC